MSRLAKKSVSLAVGLVVALTLADVSLAAEPTTEDTQFQITRPKPGEHLTPGTPYVAEGKHRRPMTATAWLFVVDLYGGYYLQNPAIHFKRDHTWEMTNLRPGKEISHVVAIEVNSRGNERVREWARDGRFGRISEREVFDLPGCIELCRQRINTNGR